MPHTLPGYTFTLKHKESMANVNADISGTTTDDDSRNAQRRKREFIPNEQKDDGYWDKRKKNNEASRRSWEKRQANDMVLETRVLGLLEENARLKAELLALKYQYGLVKDVSDMAVLPILMPSSNHPTPAAPHYYQLNSESISDPHTISYKHQPSHHPYPGQYSRLYGSRAALATPGCDVASVSKVSTHGSTHMGSPLLFEVGLSEHNRHAPRVLKEHVCESLYTVEAEGTYRWGPETGEGMKSLPHKLRFKAPNSVREGVESHTSLRSRHGNNVAAVRPRIYQPNQEARLVKGVVKWPREECHCGLEQQYHCPSLDNHITLTPENTTDPQSMSENSNFQTLLSSLSEEVARIKELFSQQLLAKLTLNRSLTLPPKGGGKRTNCKADKQ